MSQSASGESKIRLGFVSADHLHFPGLLRAALECHTAEVVGMVVDDPEHRAFLAGRFSGVTAYATADELYERARPQAIVTTRNNRDAVVVVKEAAERGVHIMSDYVNVRRM